MHRTPELRGRACVVGSGSIPMPDESEDQPSGARPRSRLRWGILLAILLLGIAARVALPYLLRPQLESQLSALIDGRVSIAVLRLSLLQGVVGLERIDVFSAADETGEPVVALGDLELDLSWGDLFSKRVRIETLRLANPTVNVRRLVSGDVNLSRLVVASEEDDGASGEPSEWTVGLDEVVLESGALHFVDDAVAASEPIALEIDNIDIERAEVVGHVYSAPMHFTLVATVSGAPFEISGDLTQSDGGKAEVAITMDRLPLHLAQPYLDLGWTAVEGALSLDLVYELEGESVSRVRGTVRVDGAKISVEGLDRAALALTVATDLKSIDLIGRKAEVGALRIESGSVVLRPQSPSPLPLIVRGAAPAESETALEAVEATGEPADAWEWSMADLQIESFEVFAEGENTAIPFALGVTAKGMTSAKSGRFPIDVRVSDGDAVLQVSGQAGFNPISADTEITWSAVDIPRWLAIAPVDGAEALVAARSEGKLTFSTSSADGTVIGGSLQVSAVEARDPGEDFSVKLPRFVVDLERVSVAESTGVEALIKRVSIEEPRLILTLEQAGLVLPGVGGAGDPGDPGAAPAVAEDSEQEASSLSVRIGEVSVAGGELTFHDRTVVPPATIALQDLVVQATSVEMAGPTVQKFRVGVGERGGGKLTVEGTYKDSKGKVAIDMDSWTLAPFNPYAVTYTGAEVARGGLTLDTKIDIDGSAINSANKLVLSQFAVSPQGDGDFFRDQLGLPLNLALELLRDEKGDISLDLPFRSGAVDSKLAMAELLAKTLKTVLMSSLKAPLKLLGAVTIQGGKIAGFGVAPIGFGVATAEPDLAALAGLGETLKTKTGLRIAVEGVVTKEDEAALRERIAGKKLASDHPEVAAYLDARRAGVDATLEPAAAEILRQAASSVTIPRDDVAALADERADTVRRVLREKHGVDASRLALTRSVGRVASGAPRVEVEIGAGGF